MSTLPNRLQHLRIEACRWKNPVECRGHLSDHYVTDPVRYPPKCGVCRELVDMAHALATSTLHDQLARSVEVFARGWDAGVQGFRSMLCQWCKAGDCPAHDKIEQAARQRRDPAQNVINFERERAKRKGV